MNKKQIKRITGATALSVACSLAVADAKHYNNMLIGDRASGLGGAYTAISDDAAGLFYNPAGIVFAEDLKLSASVNAFHSSKLTYKGVLGTGDWERESSNLIPNFFGMTQKMGSGYFGFSYAVTDSDVENQDSRFTTVPGTSLFLVNINNRDSTTKIGPSYAFSISDTFNFGVTLYFHQRERELINNQWIRLDNNSNEWSNTYFETEETGLNPILGLLWSPSEDLSLGVSARKTFILSSSSDSQISCSSDINNPAIQSAICIPVAGSPQDPVLSSSKEERELPLNVRFGIAYFPSNRFLLGFDVSYYEATSDNFAKTEETINLAAGLEYYYSANWALRGGLYTNNANTPELDAAKLNQLDHVDLTGMSFSLTRFTRSSSVTFGFTYSSGEGEAQVISGLSDIQKLEQTSQTFYLSTSYQF